MSDFTAGLDWIELMLEQHGWLLWSLLALSVVTLILSLVLIPRLVIHLPADYYRREERGPPLAADAAARARYLLLRAARNSVGLLLLLAGLAMLVLPGQGLLTILAGLALLDFPGKRRLEIRILRSPGVERVVTWLRARAGRPPLEL